MGKGMGWGGVRRDGSDWNGMEWNGIVCLSFELAGCSFLYRMERKNERRKEGKKGEGRGGEEGEGGMGGMGGEGRMGWDGTAYLCKKRGAKMQVRDGCQGGTARHDDSAAYDHHRQK